MVNQNRQQTVDFDQYRSKKGTLLNGIMMLQSLKMCHIGAFVVNQLFGLA